MFFHLKKRKKQGYILFETVLALIVFGMLSIAFFMIFSGQFSMINSSRDALQAQQYAQVEAEMLRISEYEDLESKVKARSPMTSWANPGNVWESAITLDNEQTTTVGKTRIAHVSVYRRGDTLSRFSLDVPLSSQVMSAYVRNENYSGNNKQDEHEETIIPGQISMYYDGKRIHTYFKDENGKKIEVDNMAIHTIMAYLGKLEDIPDGWHLCDGTNGTNDLRGLFIRGFGSYTFTQDHGANGGTFAREHVSAGTVGDVQGDATYWIRSSTDAFFLALGGATGYTLGWLNSPTWFGSRIGYQQFRFTSGGYWGISNTNHQGSPASSAYVGHYYFIPYAGFGHYKYRLRSSGGGMSADGKTAYPPTYSLEEYYEPASSSEGFTEMGSAFQIASDTQLAAPVDVNHNEIRPINKTVYFIEKIGTN